MDISTYLNNSLNLNTKSLEDLPQESVLAAQGFSDIIVCFYSSSIISLSGGRRHIYNGDLECCGSTCGGLKYYVLACFTLSVAFLYVRSHGMWCPQCVMPLLCGASGCVCVQMLSLNVMAMVAVFSLGQGLTVSHVWCKH